MEGCAYRSGSTTGASGAAGGRTTVMASDGFEERRRGGAGSGCAAYPARGVNVLVVGDVGWLHAGRERNEEEVRGLSVAPAGDRRRGGRNACQCRVREVCAFPALTPLSWRRRIHVCHPRLDTAAWSHVSSTARREAGGAAYGADQPNLVVVRARHTSHTIRWRISRRPALARHPQRRRGVELDVPHKPQAIWSLLGPSAGSGRCKRGGRTSAPSRSPSRAMKAPRRA